MDVRVELQGTIEGVACQRAQAVVALKLFDCLVEVGSCERAASGETAITLSVCEQSVI